MLLRDLHFQSSKPNEEVFFSELRQEVHAHISKTPNWVNLAYLWWRASFYLAAYFGVWFLLCFHGKELGAPIAVLAVFALGFFGTGVALNVGHEASHETFSSSSWINSVVYWIGMSAMGISGYLWKIGHLSTHHRFVNVAGHDVGIDANHQLRLSSETPANPRYRYQAFYGPVMYLFYTLSLVLLKDFRVFAKGSMAGYSFSRNFFRFVELIAIKAIYLYAMIYLPYRYSGFSLGEVIGAWIVMNMVLSLYVSASLFTSHINSRVSYPEVNAEGEIQISYLEQQLASTLDIHPKSWVLNFMLDGFNSHAIHHLFPRVSSFYYPGMTEPLKRLAAKHGLPYYQGGFVEAARLHLDHLKRMGEA